MTDYETLKSMLIRAGIDFTDSMSGLPRRHFIEIIDADKSRVVFRFDPDGSLADVYSLEAETLRS